MRVIRNDREERLEKLDKVLDVILEIAGCVDLGRGILELNIVDEKVMTELNEVYKKRKGPAEILTFSYLDDETTDSAEDSPIGEIYLCWTQVVKGAMSRGVEPGSYLLRLFVHGICHLMNYSHGDEESARIMENREREFLKGYLSRDEMARLFTQ
jgi:probable rRNA maturation factor